MPKAPPRSSASAHVNPKATPRERGFTFPAEFERQCATWLSWPRPEGISFPGKYHTVPHNLARIVHAIAHRQDVHINVLNDNWARLVRDQLVHFGLPAKLARERVYFHHIPTNECWCRDHGPAFVVKNGFSQGGPDGSHWAPAGHGPSKPALSQHVAIVDWAFNAWGGKYPPWEADDNVPSVIAQRAKLPLWRVPIVMEGGSVEFNGRGTVLTTTQCLLNKNRNPGLSKATVERALRDYYGQSHVLWLAEGIEGDDTDGHIDDLGRFISPTKLLIAIEDNKRDANYKQLDRALTKLFAMKDQDGRPFDIVTIPMPAPVVHDGERLPATYINFLFIDGECLVPVFGATASAKKTDDRALAIMQDHLPYHRVVPIDCRELIWGLGAIHCLSQQVPMVEGLAQHLRAIASPVP
jgi:agmatine deiminase